MIYITGDVHGDAKDFRHRLHSVHNAVTRRGQGIDIGPSIDDVVIIAGDVGLAYGSYRSMGLYKLMSEDYAHVTFIIVRGNHDTRYFRDHTSDAEHPHDGFEISHEYGDSVLYDKSTPNIVYVRDDGGRYVIGDKEILIVPGAYSVDGRYRQCNGLPYEREELLTTKEMDRLIGISEDMCDACGSMYVVSHTCPNSWLPAISDLFLSGVNQDDVDRGMEKMLDVVYDNVRGICNRLYFGHYHDDRVVSGTNGVGRMLFHDIVPFE